MDNTIYAIFHYAILAVLIREIRDLNQNFNNPTCPKELGIELFGFSNGNLLIDIVRIKVI